MTSAVRDALSMADLVGTWLLRDWSLLLDDGQVAAPFGPHPQGIVVYTAEGRMLTTIGARDRGVGDADLVSGTDAARQAAVRSFVAYSGTFLVEGQDVIHAVEMSLEPRWVGTKQRRHVELADDGRGLVLSTDPLLVNGRFGRHRLTWERASAHEDMPR